MLVIIQLETKDFTELFAQNCPSPSFVMHSMTLETAGYPTFVSSPRRFGAARSIILNKHILKNVRVFEEERQWMYIQIINNLYIYKRKQIKIKVKWHGVDYNFRGGKIDIDKTICLQRYRQSDNGLEQEAEGSVRYYRKEKSVLSYSDSFGLSATLISCIVASIYISRSLVDQGHSRLKAGTYP